jgi:AP-3 complex subunit delta-1
MDFDWYIDVLTQLNRIAPIPRWIDTESQTSPKPTPTDISERVGEEIRNVAVKVQAVRLAAVRAAELIIAQINSESASSPSITSAALKPVAWVAGEYSSLLASPEDTLTFLLQLAPKITNAEIVAACLQSIIKIFALVTGDCQSMWTLERKSRTSLLMARLIHVLEPFGSHPYLEVQERAVEFIELLKLTVEAASGQPSSSDGLPQEPPLLLTQAIPSLFQGWELHSVAPSAQSNVPLPEGLDLDEPIHQTLSDLLAQAEPLMLPTQEDDEFEMYYRQRPVPTSISNEPALNRLADAPEDVVSSYQQADEESYLDPDIVARRKAERLERNRDDPFYIQESGRSPRASTPIHEILQNHNGQDLDVDSIPIMQLDLDKLNSGISDKPKAESSRTRPKTRQKVIIAVDETIASSGVSTPHNYESENNSDSLTKSRAKKLKQSLLQVDSSHLSSLTLEGDQSNSGSHDFERQKREEAEMAQAMKEVERIRLEMQRANERIQVAKGVPVEGTVVKKKKAKKPKAEDGDGATVKVKKKKKKGAVVDGGGGSEAVAATAEDPAEVVKTKKKKSTRVVQLDDAGELAPQ